MQTGVLIVKIGCATIPHFTYDDAIGDVELQVQDSNEKAAITAVVSNISDTATWWIIRNNKTIDHIITTVLAQTHFLNTGIYCFCSHLLDSSSMSSLVYER